MSIQGEKLKAIADAIRAKKGTTEPIIADNFASEIASIETGGGATESKLPQVADKSVTELTASDLAGATKLGDNAFYGCKSLISVEIPNSVTSIGISVFRECNSLKNTIIPNSVTTFGGYIFYNCSSLAEITIPNSVTSIDAQVFSGCKSLTTITVLATTPPTLKSTNAISTATTTIYIPAGTLAAYQAASNWKTYASKFVELSE